MKRSRLDRDPDLDASHLGSSGLTGTDPDLDAALDDTVADVELDEALDELGEAPHPDPTVAEDEDGPGYDPEAGRGAIANKTSITGAVFSESGMFVLGALAALAGITSIIFAINMQTRPYIITAAVVAPPTLGWFVLRWRRWLGGAPYLYRLLASLGERDDAQEILDRHLVKQEAKVRSKIAKLEAEQGIGEGESADDESAPRS